jgi:arsenate reductase (thioredoxin)
LDTIVNARIDEAVDRLTAEFKGTFSQETISKCAFESLQAFEQARLVEFIPLLTYRFTRERLMALAQVEGLVTKEMPEVLFVCVHNAGRSQMAAALTAALSDNRVHVRSAGSAPADQINPAVIEVMNELGLDMSVEYPKPLTDEVVRAADVVITMGCGDACPLYPGKEYHDWEVDDPEGQTIPRVREIRDSIRSRVEELLRRLEIPVRDLIGPKAH